MRILLSKQEQLAKQLVRNLSKARTAKRIAALLRDAGVTGNTKPSTCPIARYMRKNGIVAPLVGSEFMGFGGRGYVGSKYHLPLPQTIQKFVEMFDEGKFPDLKQKRH
jgi:hypothetical protein